MKNTLNTFLKGLPLVFIAASPALADTKDWLADFYGTLNLGIASSQVSEGEVQAEFERAGFSSTTVSRVDDDRIGFALGVGYTFTERWAIEFGYVDLQQVDVTFTSTESVDRLDEVHPESGDGVAASLLYRHPLNDTTHIRARAGVFNWRATYRTSAGSGSGTASDSDSGTDVFWGVGFGHQFNPNLVLAAELQMFDFDRDNTRYVALGAEWHY